jgi:ribosomal protein S18 acetylase RimI-like enzyme
VPKHEIRRMAPADLDDVVTVWRRSRDDNQPWLEARMRYTRDDDLPFFRDVVARENEVWLAVGERGVLGLLALHDGFIEQLYVDPPAQRSGVGRALLERAIALYPGGLALYTHQRNRRARAFYESFGFRPVAFGVSGSPECEPDVRYAWSPDSRAPAAQ